MFFLHYDAIIVKGAFALHKKIYDNPALKLKDMCCAKWDILYITRVICRATHNGAVATHFSPQYNIHSASIWKPFEKLF